jgi:hypothetical protein
MTNAQLLPLPAYKVKVKVNENIVDQTATPNGKKVKIIWGSLLDKNTKDLTAISLATNVTFSNYVEKTRTEFKKDIKNLRKFPKMTDKDWE